jgi:hypothetical protein
MYLGIIITDQHFLWKEHLCKKLRLCALRYSSLRWYIPRRILIVIYHALVESVISYGITI